MTYRSQSFQPCQAMPYYRQFWASPSSSCPSFLFLAIVTTSWRQRFTPWHGKSIGTMYSRVIRRASIAAAFIRLLNAAANWYVVANVISQANMSLSEFNQFYRPSIRKSLDRLLVTDRCLSHWDLTRAIKWLSSELTRKILAQYQERKCWS